MAKTKRKAKKKNLKRKRIISGVLIALFVIIAGVLFYINSNFNKLISSKIHTLYNQSEAASYYDLRFDKLRVNLINMSVRVYGVHFYPLKKDHPDFFQKNGSVEVEIGKVVLKNASIIDFLSSNNISIDAFEIKDSKIRIFETSDNFQPFAFIKHEDKQSSLEINIAIQNININKAELIYYKNNSTKAEDRFNNFNLELSKLSFIKKKSFTFSFDKLMASLNDISYRGNKGAYISMKQFQFGVSSFESQNKEGKFSFDFSDLFFQISQPQFITPDSIYTISAQKIILNKSHKRMTISKVFVHPNLDEKAFTKQFKYQKLRPEIKIQDIKLSNIDFDRLVDKKGIFADSLIISGAQAKLSKSKRKPLNKRKFPNYLALQIKSIKYPLNIKVVSANNVDITFNLEQEDGQISHVDINKLRGELHNIQNQNSRQQLRLTAKGILENKIPFSTQLTFSYAQNRFSYSVDIYKSNLHSISKMIQSFAPVLIKSGAIKSIKVKGIANRTNSRGKMTFVYNNLNIQIEKSEVEKKNKFGNQILSLAANTYLLSNNPTDPGLPPREVQFLAKRDMNKGFIHILIQSLLSGVKETLIPSRENRQRYKEMKKKTKQ